MRTFLTTVCLSIAFVATAAAQQIVTETEPNDTAAQAQPIQPGQHLACSFAATADEDWFSFTLAAPAQVHLRSVNQGTLSLSTTRDTRIALYDAAGNVRLAWNDAASGTRADCGVTVPAGSYCWRVGLKATISAPAVYDLDFVALPVNPITAVEGAEPNDPTLPGGGAPTPIALGDTVEGNLASPTDVDFWAFTIAVPGVLQVVSYDDGGIPQLDNLALRYYQELTPGVWNAIGTGNATNSLSHRVTTLTHTGLLQPGNYAVAVMAGTAVTGTAPWDFQKVGQYSLRTRFLAMLGSAQLPEAAEPNSSTTTAGLCVLGEDCLGSAQSGNDPDWYAFTISAPITISAMAEGTGLLGGSPLPGSTLRLWDANGVSVGSASGSATTHGRLITTLTLPGTYYLEIAASQFAMSGDYLLHTGASTPLYIPSTTRVEPASTNACIGSNTLRPLLGYLPGETPVFNSTFVTRIERTVGPTFVILTLGLSNVTAAGGTVLLPVLLGFGLPDSQSQPTPCYLRVDPVVMLLAVTDAAGTTEFGWTFPWQPSATGTRVYEQVICWDPTLNPLGISVSNDASFVVGDVPF